MSGESTFAPISMDGHTLSRVSIRLNDQVDPRQPGVYNIDLRAGFPPEVQMPGIQVALGIHLVKTDEGCRYDEVEIAGEGRFSVPLGMPPEEVVSFAIPSAMNLLYGVFRGVVAALTASFPDGSFHLPAISGSAFRPASPPPVKQAEVPKTKGRRKSR